MARVPSTYATMVSEVSADEDFDQSIHKSDGAVVRLVAVVSADDSVRGGLDAAEIFQQSFVDGSDIYGRSDLATISMTGLPSGIDGLVFSDAAVVALTAVPSATEFHSVIYTDTATALLTNAAVSGTDVASFSDSAIAFLVSRIYNNTEASTVTMVSQEVEHDDTHQTVEAATITMTGVTSTQWEVHNNVDAATATLVGVPSGIDGKTWSDADTIAVVGIPSSTDYISHTYLDLATVTLTAAESDTEIYGHVDAATVTLTSVISALDVHDSPEAGTETFTAVITAVETHNGVDAATATLTGVVSATEIHGLPEDAATVTLIGVVSGAEVYTPFVVPVTGFGRSLATLSTTTSATANFKADASAPASGSMLVAQAIVNNLQTIATPSGYTALPSNPTTLAAHHIYVFYKIADGVETSVTLTWGANNNCAMYTRYYTTPAYSNLVEITSAVAAGAASDMKVTMTADAPASGLGLLAMLFHDGSHWYDGGLTQFGGSTFTHENNSLNWNGNANGTMGSDDITSLPASTVRYGCGWHYAFGSFSAASVAGKILAIAP